MNNCTCSLQGPDKHCSGGRKLFQEVEREYLLIEGADFPTMMTPEWRKWILEAYEEEREHYFKHIALTMCTQED